MGAFVFGGCGVEQSPLSSYKIRRSTSGRGTRVKITRLQKAKDYRIFRDFVWPVSGLPDFARFNVIYGWNGAGKSSLSNIFRHIQRKAALTEGQVEIVVDQTRVAGGDFATAAVPEVRTFNRDTVDQNIFEAPNQQFPPVFFLGEDSVEKQKRIEELKREMGVHVQAESRWDRKKADANTAFDSFCADEAKGIKNLLTVAGGGAFNNYNAANFKAEAQSLVNISPIPELLTDEERQQHLAAKDGKAMERVAEPLINFPDFAGLTTRAQAMLKRSVVSSVIGELAENPAVAAWVNAGLGLHIGENASSKCRFCDQLLPEQRVLQLEAHFNDEFRRFQTDLDRLVGEIMSAQDFTKFLSVPPKEALYLALRPQYEKATDTLAQQAGTVRLSLDVLLRALKAKRDEPFKRFELGHFITNSTPAGGPAGGVEAFFRVVVAGMAALGAAMGKNAFDQLKGIIERHNKHTECFDAEVKMAREALARHEVLKALAEWAKKSTAVADARDQAATARGQAAKLKTEIDELEVIVRQHRRPRRASR
jgi:hypothetical protein